MRLSALPVHIATDVCRGAGLVCRNRECWRIHDSQLCVSVSSDHKRPRQFCADLSSLSGLICRVRQKMRLSTPMATMQFARRLLSRWLLTMGRTAEYLRRYRTQSHIVPEIRKLGRQSYIASSRKALTGCPAQQQSSFQRPWLHLDCISSRAPSCSLQDNVQQLTASLIDQSVIQALSNICRQPQICHTSHQ